MRHAVNLPHLEASSREAGLGLGDLGVGRVIEGQLFKALSAERGRARSDFPLGLRVQLRLLQAVGALLHAINFFQLAHGVAMTVQRVAEARHVYAQQGLGFFGV